MGELLVKAKEIVVPGQILANGMDFLPANGTFRESDNIIASQLGLANIDGRLIKIIPLNGKYTPKRGDTIIGRIVDMSFSNWYVDIGCANDAVMSSRDSTEFVEKGADLNQYYSFGDYISAQVTKVTRSTTEITMRAPGLRKLGPGKIMKVAPSKVPRIIGKQGSMISLIKDKTGTRIIVGQNGLVWVSGEPENVFIASDAIEMIEKKAHIEGLTEEITKFLESRCKNLAVVKGEKNVQEKK